jgi:hypothetical protein
MSTERRESLRTEVTLPFKWLACAARTPADQLCKLFGLPGFIRIHGKLAELASEFSRALHDIRDPATVGALEVLDAKLGVLEEALHAETAIPTEQPLELAAEGIGFDSAQTLAPGSWLGVHLVLPTAYHLVCGAQVTHCKAADSGYRIGALLCDMDTAAAKRLTRFVIGAH